MQVSLMRKCVYFPHILAAVEKYIDGFFQNKIFPNWFFLQ
jgi:hypothetical protein